MKKLIREVVLLIGWATLAALTWVCIMTLLG